MLSRFLTPMIFIINIISVIKIYKAEPLKIPPESKQRKPPEN
jgi:hypothetical protein